MLKVTNSPSKKKKKKKNNNNKKEANKQTKKKKEIKKQRTNTGPTFYGYSEKPPHSSRLFPVAKGYGGHILVLNPESQRGGGGGK